MLTNDYDTSSTQDLQMMCMEQQLLEDGDGWDEPTNLWDGELEDTYADEAEEEQAEPTAEQEAAECLSGLHQTANRMSRDEVKQWWQDNAHLVKRDKRNEGSERPKWGPHEELGLKVVNKNKYGKYLSNAPNKPAHPEQLIAEWYRDGYSRKVGAPAPRQDKPSKPVVNHKADQDWSSYHLLATRPCPVQWKWVEPELTYAEKREKARVLRMPHRVLGNVTWVLGDEKEVRGLSHAEVVQCRGKKHAGKVMQIADGLTNWKVTQAHEDYLKRELRGELRPMSVEALAGEDGEWDDWYGVTDDSWGQLADSYDRAQLEPVQALTQKQEETLAKRCLEITLEARERVQLQGLRKKMQRLLPVLGR